MESYFDTFWNHSRNGMIIYLELNVVLHDCILSLQNEEYFSNLESNTFWFFCIQMILQEIFVPRLPTYC